MTSSSRRAKRPKRAKPAPPAQPSPAEQLKILERVFPQLVRKKPH